jgi:hypothetical protein
VALQKRHKMQLQNTWSPSNHSDARVPWMPTGCHTHTRKEFPERFGAAGDGSPAEETFHPRLTDTPSARVRL